MAKIIMLRHGASVWNEWNLFTGWVDIPLSQKGIEESLAAGKKISSIAVDVIFVSTLVRAMQTAMLAMSLHASGKVPYILHPDQEWSFIHSEESRKKCIPVYTAWQLNERMYGDLQGMNKQEMREKFGDEKVLLWRRSDEVAPPGGESLKMTAERTLPYFREMIVPQLKLGKNVLVSAHGNSLRSIIMELDGLSTEEVVSLEIPTGVPLVYAYENGKWARANA